MVKRKKGEHYVDNKVFLQAMIEWRDKCDYGLKRQAINRHLLRTISVSVF